MAVKETYIPNRVVETDPTKIASQPSAPEDDAYWKGRRDAARARREYMEESALTERIQNPSAPEPPVAISGKINLGEFNIQEQQKQATEAAERARIAAEEREETLRRERDAAKGELVQEQIRTLQTSFEQRLQGIVNALNQNQNKESPSFIDQYKGFVMVAKELGLNSPPDPGAADISARLAVLKLEAEIKRADREFEWRMEEARRQARIDEKRYGLEEAESAARIQAEQERNEIFTNLPALVGGAIAAGVKHKGKEDGDQPEKKAKSFSIEVGAGEAGEFDCPNCQAPVALGPTTTTAICANCQSKFPIKRIKE